MPSRLLAALLVRAALLLLAAPNAAAARAEGPVEGMVVRVDEVEVVVDLGSERGVPPGALLHVYRRIVVKHPVTGKAIVDRFPIGTVRADEVGSLLTIVRDVAGLKRRPQLGDYMVFGPPPPPPRPPSPTRPSRALRPRFASPRTRPRSTPSSAARWGAR